jgi:hypothetical protein
MAIAIRLKEKLKDAIAFNIKRADKKYSDGKVLRGTVADVMAELKR